MQILRHKTAIRRPGLSVPIQCLIRDGLLNETVNLFDYGCGHGQDIALVSDLGISADGWDPAYRPDAQIAPASIVNLGFVLNVIEDPLERADVLRRAWGLCQELLVVSTIMPGDTASTLNRQQFADGLLTTRGTFQKYFSHNELRAYLQEVLQYDAVPAAPNVFYIFRDPEAQQRVLAARYTRTAAVPKQRISDKLFEDNRDLLEAFMGVLTELGRLPGPDEFSQYAELELALGSAKRALHLVAKVTGIAPWQAIAQRRKEDTLVYLALARFGARKPLSDLPEALRRDIRAFIGTYAAAAEQANTLLFSVGNTTQIDAACREYFEHEVKAIAGVAEPVEESHEKGVNAFIPELSNNALIVPISCLQNLPPILRVYEGCARALVGEIEGTDYVKLHRFSGKVTYLIGASPASERIVGPDGEALIACRQRVKVNLRTLDISFFEYE